MRTPGLLSSCLLLQLLASCAALSSSQGNSSNKAGERMDSKWDLIMVDYRAPNRKPNGETWDSVWGKPDVFAVVTVGNHQNWTDTRQDKLASDFGKFAILNGISREELQSSVKAELFDSEKWDWDRPPELMARCEGALIPDEAFRGGTFEFCRSSDYAIRYELRPRSNTGYYNLELISVRVPQATSRNGAWDVYDGASDPFVAFEVGPMKGVTGVLTDVRGATLEQLSSRRSNEDPEIASIPENLALQTGISITVLDRDPNASDRVVSWEVDPDYPDDDVIASCSSVIAPEDLDGRVITNDCVGTAGLAINYRFVAGYLGDPVSLGEVEESGETAQPATPPEEEDVDDEMSDSEEADGTDEVTEGDPPPTESDEEPQGPPAPEETPPAPAPAPAPTPTPPATGSGPNGCGAAPVYDHGTYVGCATYVDGHSNFSTPTGLTEYGCRTFCDALEDPLPPAY